MQEITGECFCGALSYSISGEIPPGTCCHCSRCRKAFSGSGSAMSPVETEAFHWTRGQEFLQTYESKKGPGIGFCKVCGTTLVGLYFGDVKGISLGTLNDDPEVVIGRHIFVGSKACWDHIGGEAPQYEEWPSEGL